MSFRPWLRWGFVACSGIVLAGCQNSSPRTTYPPTALPAGQQAGRTPPPTWPVAGNGAPTNFSAPTGASAAAATYPTMAPAGGPTGGLQPGMRPTSSMNVGTPGGLAPGAVAPQATWPNGAPVVPAGGSFNAAPPSMTPAAPGRIITTVPPQSPMPTPSFPQGPTTSAPASPTLPGAPGGFGPLPTQPTNP
jgi:hypothetical protein